MNIVTGNLIDLALAGEFDVIIHGCNCQKTMGAGIAREIRDRLPQAWKADQETTSVRLGEYSLAYAENNVGGRFAVVNAYTQIYPGKGSFSYNAVEFAFMNMKDEFKGKRFGYPKIGAGLAGGHWDVIAGLIDKVMAGENHTLVVLPYN